MHMDKKDFGRRIKAERIKKGYTQQSLSDALDVSKTSVTMYEQGQRFPREEVLNDLAQLLDVSIDYLMGLTEIPRITQQPSNRIEKNELNIKVVPVYSAAGAGSGRITQENAVYNMQTLKGDFGVIVEGDSMSPRITPGAVVFVKKVNSFEELKRGEAVVVRINSDEATVKYWDVEPGQGAVLRSENREYTPKFVPFEQFYTNEAAVLGRVVGVYNNEVPNYFE